MSESVLNIKELAKYLNVTERTIYNLLDRGELPAFRVGASWRFKKEDIEAWIEDNKERIRKEKLNMAKRHDKVTK